MFNTNLYTAALSGTTILCNFNQSNFHDKVEANKPQYFQQVEKTGQGSNM